MKRCCKKRTTGIVLALLIGFLALPQNVLATEKGVNNEENAYEQNGSYIFDELDQNAPALETQVNDLYRTSPVPSSYGKDRSWLNTRFPQVRDQNPYGTCWAFSSVGLAEFDAINDKICNQDVDLSELQLAYFTYNSVVDPLGGTKGDTAQFVTAPGGTNYLNMGGNYQMASRRLAQWVGMVDETKVPYSKAEASLGDGVDGKYAYGESRLHLENAYVISLKKNAQEVKRQIMIHGAAGTAYQHQQSALSYNATLGQYVYCDADYNGGGHAVMIVGWDDNFSRDNFNGKNKPANNGAWLIRNSWGSYVDYFWMSYDSVSLQDGAWIFDFTSSDNYDNNYQLDGGLDVYPTKYTTVANVYEVGSKDGVAAETLKAVSVSTTRQTNVNYTIRVYTDLQKDSDPTSGTLWESAITSGTTSYAGIHTIPLKNPVVLMPNTKYAVVVTVNKEAIDYEQAVTLEFDDGSKLKCAVSSTSGNSFYMPDTSSRFYSWGWGNFAIKAFTDNETTVPSDLKPGTHQCEEHWNSTYTVDVPPTCTQTGSRSVHCSICGAVKEGTTEMIPATGHQWQQTGTQGGVTTYHCSVCGADKTEGTAWNGLHKAADGKLYLYENGNINRNYTDLYNDSTYGWRKVTKGVVDAGYTDLYYSPTYGWWKVINGTVDFGYSDLYYSPSCGWWKVINGTVDFGYSDLYYSPSCGWWKVINGTVDFGYSDLYNSPSCGWWKVINGTVDFGYSDLYNSPSCGWWKVINGTVDFGYSDLYCSPSCGWWKVINGTVDFGYTGWYCSPACGWWQIQGGAVVFI